MVEIPVPRQLFTDDRVTAMAMRLYGILKADPTQRKSDLSRTSGKSQRVVAENLELLVRLGYVVVHETRARGNVEISYEFPIDVPPAELAKAS